MVKSRHRLENHSTTNLTYNIHCTLLLDYNKQQFHSKESLTRLFQQGLLMRATVRQDTGYPSKRPHGRPKALAKAH